VTAAARRQRFRAALLAVPAAGVVLVATSGPAAAHAYLVSSTPASAATVAAIPQVVLRFDEAVNRSFAVVRVTGHDGRRWDVGSPSVAGATVTQRLAPLPAAGAYALSYRVVSDDGHPVSQELHFTFAPPPGYVPSAAPQAVIRPAAHVSARAGRPSRSWLSAHASELLVLAAAILAGASVLLVGRRRHT